MQGKGATIRCDNEVVTDEIGDTSNLERFHLENIVCLGQHYFMRF